MNEGFRVTPEPSEDDRAIVLAALEVVRAEEGDGLDPWTAAALREAAAREPDS